MDNIENIENNDDYGKMTFVQNSEATTIGPIPNLMELLLQVLLINAQTVEN